MNQINAPHSAIHEVGLLYLTHMEHKLIDPTVPFAVPAAKEVR